MDYPKLNGDPEISKIKIKHDFFGKKREKHDQKNVSKSIKTDIKYYRRKYKSSDKKKILLIITQKLMRSR